MQHVRASPDGKQREQAPALHTIAEASKFGWYRTLLGIGQGEKAGGTQATSKGARSSILRLLPLEVDEDDFGVCAEAEGRTPGTGPPGGEYEHFPEAI